MVYLCGLTRGVFMTGEEAIAYIHSLLPFGVQPGLERITALCERLGNPQNSLRFVHVAGTNGKGSTSTMLAGVLQQAGLRTGLFTSPYVKDFRERIRCDGEMISLPALADTAQRVRAESEALALQGISVTEFEALTATAFLYFQQECCDIVVLEVGLGGSFDATNVIDSALVSVICCIALDHIAILGDTLTEIAKNKCGICKQNGQTVSYPFQEAEAMAVIREQTAQLHNFLTLPDCNALEIAEEQLSGSVFIYQKQQYRVPFVGKHMIYNALTVIETVQALRNVDIAIPQYAVAEGMARAKMPARMELLNEKPPVLLDGGHNSSCAQALSAVLEQFWNKKRIICVCAMMADKDYRDYLRILAPHITHLYACELQMERALPAAELARAAQDHAIPCSILPDPRQALEQAENLAGSNGAVLVCGSFYLVNALQNERESGA